jgi:protein-S-isoprenylcysteine O-methyltransferase Ste14
MGKENMVALLHALSGAGALILSIFTKGTIAGSDYPFKTIGFVIFAVGMVLFAYTVLYLKDAFRGNIQPVMEDLIRSGPYRIIRHPLYLSMLIAVWGLSFGMRSLWGLVVTCVIFLPAGIVRAKLEERALRKKFPNLWKEYEERTYFILPLIY